MFVMFVSLVTVMILSTLLSPFVFSFWLDLNNVDLSPIVDFLCAFDRIVNLCHVTTLTEATDSPTPYNVQTHIDIIYLFKVKIFIIFKYTDCFFFSKSTISDLFFIYNNRTTWYSQINVRPSGIEETQLKITCILYILCHYSLI